MKLKQLFADDNAVSPVIGVILMVAITVILAAVIGTFVLGLGENLQQTSPTASFTASYDSTDEELKISHDGGDSVKAAQTAVIFEDVVTDGSSGSTWNQWESTNIEDITAGESITIAADTTNGETFSDATVKLTWESQSGDSSATLYEWSGPDA